MAEVITLSDDDDDVIPLTPRPPVVLKTSTTANHGNNSQATVHVSTGKNLNFDQIGIRRLSDVYNKNQPAFRGNEIPTGIRNSRPSLPATAILQNPQFLVQLAAKGLKRPFSSVHSTPAVVPSTSIQRTRNNQNAGNTPNIYKGHYMFEATESYEPSRRSSRYNTKKIEGKFMCSYNPTKCYKLCGSVVEVINHIWAHVIHDPPLPPIEKKESKDDGMFSCLLRNSDAAQLAENSALSLKRLQTCQFCNAVFRTVHLKTIHVVKCHMEQDHLDTTCNICELDFGNSIALNTHMKKHISGEAPYNCQKCKYRTSVRAFFYQHFIEKHSNDSRTLLCPICLHHEDLRPNVRRSKHIFVREFVNHMRSHALGPQMRCHVCALTFTSRLLLEAHRTNDHTMLNSLWQVIERKSVHETEREHMSKRNKIGLLQRRFFETLEGRRINDEVACAGDKEREGFDLTTTGDTLFECECGFKSWNGNRTASHYHKCRRSINDIERKREIVRLGSDPKEELELFAVYPQPTNTEAETEEATLRKIHLERGDPLPILEDIVYQPIDDLPLLKMLSKNHDKSLEIMEKCTASAVTTED
ncbi:C2H2-type domain-containing protein [Caenorhabditis elegans]|uniref:C2H2-type domain-containing protein n=1 Tax=Caenorhabditis elegans TaxID=6239 RepID=A5JYT9_CAEEL|nr:C2H2-type domain-containing protein [Caenorhabditis elegans]CAN86598.1 C2H2-type domain-containing protein [Caenorhabditis elegans]|eukprot:NP_001122473.1 Relative of Woc homolog [Caenorhabditis elegans]